MQQMYFYGELSACCSSPPLILGVNMQVKDLRKCLDEWGFVIKRTSKFTDSDRGVFKKLIELCNALTAVGIEEVPEAKYTEIAQHSTLNFRVSPPPVEEDKENAQLYRIDLLNYLAKNRKEIFAPGHRIYGAFEKYVLMVNNLEHESKYSNSPTDDFMSLSIREEQLKDDLYVFLTGEVGYSISTMTRVVFDDIIEDNWKQYINIVRETVNEKSQENYINNIISTKADKSVLSRALKEINWKTAKDGMLSYARCFNVIKSLQGNHSDDCFWVMYGAEGGEGKSVYTNGELKHFTNEKLSVYVGDNKCFGEHFNSPEPFQAKLLYVREDESWTPEQIRFKKQLVDHDYIGIEQKGKDAYRITPQCMVTSMTNYRSYDISRRFAIIDYGRNKVGVDIEALEDFVAVNKFERVSKVIYENIINNKDKDYVKNVCVKVCKATQFLNKREDKQWAFNVAVKTIQSLIIERDSELVNLDSPDFIRLDNLLNRALKTYRKSLDESKIMSNEFYKNSVGDSLKALIENGELSQDIFIGNTNDYNELVGKDKSERWSSAVVIKNKRSVWVAIDNFFRKNTKIVNNKEEEALFDKYMEFLFKIVDNGNILDMSVEKVASILECKYKLPD